MRIGILTTFYCWSKSYSLTTVVENQLLALVKHGYKPVLFVHDNFKDDDKIPEGVEVRKIIPRFELVDYREGTEISKDFDKQVKVVKNALEENMKDIDVAITHDWLFQGWFLQYNVGMREAEPNLNCKWFHLTHSAPSPRPDVKFPFDCMYKMMPNSKLIYLNHYDALKLAEMYAGTLDDVRVVNNPLDPRSFYDLDPLVSKCIDKYSLLDADIIDVYPLSSTRFDGKQPKKVIKILGKMKKQGRSVRFICCNAHANGEKEKEEIEKLLLFSIEQGLTRQEVIFTSLEGEEYEQGISNGAVRDFFLLSNLFIFPTLSENCPLILLEAAMSKNLLVLNESFAPLREFFKENALYFPFGSLLTNVAYNDEEKWYEDVAKIIIGELHVNKPLNAFKELKQKFNYDYIFKNQLEPLFYESTKPTDENSRGV